MDRNMRQEKFVGYTGGDQHIIMLQEPFPLIYNEETAEAAIQIGCLNIVSYNKEGNMDVEVHPIIRPLILSDENGETNGSGIISPYSMFVGEGAEMSAWRNICILHRGIDIEDLFPLLREYCNVADTMIQNPADIIEGLKAYGYKILMPKDKEIIIHLEPDDSRVWWNTEYPIIGGSVDSRTVTDMWFMASGGGSLGQNIEGLIENAVYYDSLFLEQNLPLPGYKFVTSEPGCEDEIKYINKNFTIALQTARKEYQSKIRYIHSPE